MAFSMVILLVYSMSLPTGIPIAMRVTFSPARRNWPDKISCRCLAFDRGIGGYDDFIDLAVLDAPHQVRYSQLVRADAV